MRVDHALVEATFADALRDVAGRLRAGDGGRVVGDGRRRVALPTEGLAVAHPFVCREGMVFGALRVDHFLALAREDLTRCPVHTYEGFPEACPRHPVVTPALLAAHRVGGPEAVESRYVAQSRRWWPSDRPSDEAPKFRPRHVRAFDPRVWRCWEGLVLALGERLWGIEDLPPMEHVLSYLGVQTGRSARTYSFAWRVRR